MNVCVCVCVSPCYVHLANSLYGEFVEKAYIGEDTLIC